MKKYLHSKYLPCISTLKSCLCLVCCLLIHTHGIIAQQEAQFTNYMFNTLVFNPAYAGSKDALSIVGVHRDQWYDWNQGSRNSGYNGRPITQTFSIHSPLQERIGVGMSITNDRIGVHETTSLDFSYAYRISFGTGKLAIGLQGGLSNWRADWEELTYKDPQFLDEAFNQNNSIWVPNFGAGVYYQSEYFYLGVSIPRIAGFAIRDNINRDVVRSWAKTYQHFYFSVGGAIPINDKAVVFKPSFLLRSVGLFSDFLSQGDEVRSIGVPTAFEVTGAFFLYEKLWLGAGFRSAFAAFAEFNGANSSNSAISGLLVYHFKMGGKLGFAYDFTLGEINNYAAGSFEIMLGWDFIRSISKTTHPRYFF